MINNYRLINSFFYRFPSLARFFYSHNCYKLLGKKELDLIYLLSFDCDNFEDIEALKKITPFLNENRIKATFAVPGEILKAGRYEFNELSKHGHEFIGHGSKRHSQIKEEKYVSTIYYHKLSDEEIESDICRGNRAIEEILGIKPRGFRIPHFGHSNYKNELKRVYRVLLKEGMEYSSSTMPLYGILYGPLFKSYCSFWELPISGSFEVPLHILDTYSFGFSKRSNRSHFKKYLFNVKKIIDQNKNKKMCLNLYCDPSQAVQMDEWFDSIIYAQEAGFKFLTLGEFYDKYRN